MPGGFGRVWRVRSVRRQLDLLVRLPGGDEDDVEVRVDCLAGCRCEWRDLHVGGQDALLGGDDAQAPRRGCEACVGDSSIS